MAGEGRLASWKEIANYLGKGVRTVQRWEQELRLPVHRIPGKKKDIVYGFPAEIDAWLRDHANHVQDPAGAIEGRPWRKWRIWLTAAVGGVVTVGALAACLVWVWPAGQPASFEVKGNKLVVYDQSRRQLWNHTFDLPLHEQAYYERISTVPPPQFVLLDDLDKDGDTELLFVFIPLNGDASERALVCFDRRGRVRWQYKLARAVRFGNELYEPPFFLSFFQVTSRTPGGSRHIWVVSHHVPQFPSVVAKLDAQGRLLGEFWHSGYVIVLAEASLGGRRMMLAGAANNEQFSGALAALDYDNPSGSSPAESEPYRCRNCLPVSPLLYYVLFPRSELSRALNSRPMVKEIRVHATRDVEATVYDESQRGGAVFQFNSRFQLRNTDVTEAYALLHNELEASGRLKHTLDRRREADALKAVRYWDGAQFSHSWVPPH